MKVNEYVPSESSTLDRKLLGDTTVCGMSSSLVQVIVAPAFTFNSCGPKVKFPILTAASAAQTGVAAKRRRAAAPAATKFFGAFVLIILALNPVTACVVWRLKLCSRSAMSKPPATSLRLRSGDRS